MRILTTVIMVFTAISIFSQTTTIEGYIYEAGNRGYLSDVSITAENIDSEKILGKSKSDVDGFFRIEVPINTKVRLYAAKDMFDIKRLETEVGEGKSFVKLEMGREPGYTFEVTLAEKKSSLGTVVDAITGTRIEVYNNTTRKSLMDLKDHDSPNFQLNLKKGNHYTILIRKNGFLSKRMEAKVDVEGCILCFEGVGKVGPGVSDNLTENNSFGVLLANVELDRIFEGKTMEVQNLYYDLNKWALSSSAKTELNKVITLMKDNPNLTIELGSHTDSQGKSDSNLTLSKKRAKSAVDYLLKNGEITKSRIVSKGYGENILLNTCSDNVKCTEEEHAINRRTELKIVGITDMKEVKSLAQMKKEEQLEAEILELMDQEQVQAKDDEELQKIVGEMEKEGEMGEIEEVEEIGEIKTDRSRRVGQNDLHALESRTTVLEVMERVSDGQTTIVDKERNAKAAGKVIEETEEEVKRENEVLEFEDVEVEIEEEVKRENEVLKEMAKVIKKKEEVKNEVIELEDTKAEIGDIGEEELIFEDVEITTHKDENSEKVAELGNTTKQKLPPVTDGIKVIVYQSEKLLGKDHFVMLRHQKAELFDNGKGKIYYMVGGFTTELDAFNFLDSFIASDKKYKDPFVAKFANGILTVLDQ